MVSPSKRWHQDSSPAGVIAEPLGQLPRTAAPAPLNLITLGPTHTFCLTRFSYKKA